MTTNEKIELFQAYLKMLPELRESWLKDRLRFTIEDEIQLKKVQRKEKLLNINNNESTL